MNDFTGCKYQTGQHVHRKSVNPEFATVWEIVAVTKNHGGMDYYHCRAEGFGSCNIYEKDIFVTNSPLPTFPK